jgi:hypothetical protein
VADSFVRRAVPAVLAALVLAAPLVAAGPAAAHGTTSEAWVTATAPANGHVRAVFALEYDLLVVSAADMEKDDPFFRAGTKAFDDFDDKEQADAIEAHAATVVRYLDQHVPVTVGGRRCIPTKAGPVRIEQRVGVPYALLPLDYGCTGKGEGHTISSSLFPGTEGYVRSTTTHVAYDLDLHSGRVDLVATHPTVSTEQTLLARSEEYFRLGVRQLLWKLDRILFLLVLIAVARRSRDTLRAIGTFTAAAVATSLLAGLNVIDVSSRIVDPAIALGIVVLAALGLWRARRGVESFGRAWFGLLFCFGLIFGLGFADALDKSRSSSWRLLSSLLVFDVGVAVAELGIIVVALAVLALLRGRAHRPAVTRG